MLGSGAGAACLSSPASLTRWRRPSEMGIVYKSPLITPDKAELATETHRSRSTEVVSSDVLLVVSVGGGTPSNEEPRPSN
jgi:hypothetical protein